jgi:class 3 adenylate cyclase
MKESIIATILIADLVNSTEMSKNLTLQEYDEMIVDFQSTMYEIVSAHLRQYDYRGDGSDSSWSIAGDEIRVFLYSGATQYDVRHALLMAVKIKLAWLVSDFNERILKEGRLVSRIGVGINCGKVVKGVREWRVKMGDANPSIEGYAINITKRIESTSREGKSYQVMVGDSLRRKCQERDSLNVVFSPPQSLAFKGLGQNMLVFEVVSFIHFELLPSMPADFREGLVEKLYYAVNQPMAEPWVFITLLRHYASLIASGKHNYLENHAVQVAKQALEVVTYKPIIYNMLGWFHIYGKSIHSLEMALQHFDESLRLEPRNRAALLHKARILETTGKEDLARKAYGEILLHNPNHPEARRKMTEYELSEQLHS